MICFSENLAVLPEFADPATVLGYKLQEAEFKMNRCDLRSPYRLKYFLQQERAQNREVSSFDWRLLFLSENSASSPDKAMFHNSQNKNITRSLII